MSLAGVRAVGRSFRSDGTPKALLDFRGSLLSSASWKCWKRWI